jgi:hypothetical protein
MGVVFRIDQPKKSENVNISYKQRKKQRCEITETVCFVGVAFQSFAASFVFITG